MAIEAKVATVISDSEVALSAGAEHGVQEKDIATVYREIEVPDPEGGFPLGVVRRPAARLLITEVQPRLSIGRSIDLVRVSDVGRLFGTGHRRKRLTGVADSAGPDVVFLQRGWVAVIEAAPVAEEDTDEGEPLEAVDVADDAAMEA